MASSGSSSSPSATLTTDTANVVPAKEKVADISPDMNLSVPVGQASPVVESHSHAPAPKYRDGDVLTNHDQQEMVDAEGKLLETFADSEDAEDTQTTTTMSENDQADEADAIEAKDEDEGRQKESRAEAEANMEDEFAENTQHDQWSDAISHDSLAVDFDVKELEEEREARVRELDDMEAEYEAESDDEDEIIVWRGFVAPLESGGA